MTKRKLFNFIIFIPFAIAIGAFIIYFKYMFTIRGIPALKVTGIMQSTMIRYRNIGVFCLAIGVVLLFIKTIINYFSINDSVEIRNERVLDRISSKQETEDVKYSFDESNIINDLLTGKTLVANFYNGKKVEKLVKFKNYNKDKNTIEFYDLTKETISEPVKKEYVKATEEYDGRYFKKCHKCHKVIAKDAPMCVHCGTMLIKDEKESNNKVINPIVFVINLIIILLCIILFLLCFNSITKQSKINRNNFNLNNIKTVNIK